ncbi:molybdopterin-dependent oxidoreductase [Lentibacter algarum]|uniref:molybdopterin-dependent oxidoreductase n=1 Tax=Lentibacter algarum TaxID=576131 RepID=UPI001C08663D|nr:molybdopterin-dependent oxidoreductase [Lentibacter algarum]MBU2983670.1 molybdopterin-dependent oxidoreductase [Lentibacter algarum]
MNKPNRPLLTNNHWGAYHPEVKDGVLSKLRPFGEDTDPSPIGSGIVDVLDGPTRITSPMVRKGWLEGRRKTGRGDEPFVKVSWEQANALVAQELERVRTEYGNQAIFAGSYGWASAGRFHHAQSQLKRLLNCIGGFTKSVNTYSYAAAEVVVPHVLGNFKAMFTDTTGWDSIAKDSTLFVAFGGVALKNGQIAAGGVGCHIQQASLRSAKAAGVDFVNISPVRGDLMAEVEADWMALRPSTDTALMLGLAHELMSQNLHDRDFLENYAVGFDIYASYLNGENDGIPKSAEWAAEICDLPVQDIRDLARRMASGRTMISVAWSLTRQDHGEQPYWAGIALAAMLGQIGLSGGGIGFGYGAENQVGLSMRKLPVAAMPQGRNSVADHIPVARIADMLQNPGAEIDFNGKRLTYPDIKLVWWAGGNPFHHHQDLNNLRAAWARPEAIIVNEWCWNSNARHADIVLPATTTLERADIALTPHDPYQTVMDQAIEPVGEAKSDHDICKGIAAQMGVENAFTEDKSPEDWQRWIYEVTRQSAAREEIDMPDWDSFQDKGWFKVAAPAKPTILLQAFRADPVANPLSTPSGKIEIFSETVAAFGYVDCPGHPAWLEPLEWLGKVTDCPLHLVSNQPSTKLHSQLDHGSVSRAAKVSGREAVYMHPEDAAARGLKSGQLVRVFNKRGACIAGLQISDGLRKGVVQMPTGAWYDPDGELCRNGNPNVLTPDKGTSSLAQGPSALTCLVEIAAAPDPAPAVRAYDGPVII